MLKVSVDIIGPDIARTYTSKLKALTGEIDKAVRYSALKIYNDAREKCPVVTGNLRGSTDIKYIYEEPTTGALIFSNVIYAREIEYAEKEHPLTYKDNGTLQQKNPQATWGYFRKALAAEEPEFKKRLERSGVRKMVIESVVAWLRANITELGTSVYLQDPLFVISEHSKPLAVVSYITHSTEQFLIGDAQRKQNIKIQITLYNSDYDSIKYLTYKVQRAIESAMTAGDIGSQVPGIDLKGVWDLLYNTSGDLKTYESLQPAWYASPAPIYYKGSAVITTGFTPDLVNGKIVFGAAQGLTDKFYATYKCGVIDFVIKDIVLPLQVTDAANKLHRYNSAFTLDTWYYIKAIGDKIY